MYIEQLHLKFMKRVILIIVLVFLQAKAYAQTNEFVIVLDSSLKEPIPFVSIQTQETIVNTNQYGEIDRKKLSQNLNILTHIAYQNKIISALCEDTIFLSKRSYEIPEVEVEVSKKINNYKLGYVNYKGKGSYSLSSSLNERFALSVYIPFDERDGMIESVLIPRKKVDGQYFYKILLMKASLAKTPGDTLAELNVKQSSNKKMDIISLKQFNLKIPKEGIFIGFEWPSSGEQNASAKVKVKMTTKLKQKLSFVKVGNQDWVPYNNFASNPRFGFLMRKF